MTCGWKRCVKMCECGFDAIHIVYIYCPKCARPIQRICTDCGKDIESSSRCKECWNSRNGI